MKLTEFLEAVTPSEGKLIVARMCDGTKSDGRTFKYFKHVVCEDHQQAKTAISRIAKSRSDVYYALASYKQGFHANAKGKTVVRVRDNVHKLKALWFDIDFKSGLSTTTEVVAALREFCNGTRMPAPSILVHSGNGIHVYWPLTRALLREDWQQLADALKHKAATAALAADLVCTADSSRVLRPVGTLNCKDPDNLKVVSAIASSGKLFDPDVLRDILVGGDAPSQSLEGGIAGEVPAYIRSSGVAERSSQELSGGVKPTNHVEYFIPNIAKKCGVLSHYLQTNGEDCSEPEWTAALQLATHAADGEIYYHSLSDGHPGYTPEETNEKWQQRKENTAGPTLCDTFAGYRPEICAACPQRHKIKTPLVLGEEEVTTAAGKEFPLKTWRPMEGNMGMERKMFEPATKEYFWEKVLDRSWELLGVSRDLVTRSGVVTVVARQGKGEEIQIDLPTTLLGDVSGLKKELATYGAPLLQSEVTHWMKLMTDWLSQLQQKRQVGDSVSRLGWIEYRDPETSLIDIKGFTAGDASYLVNGQDKKGLRIASEYREVARNFIPTGDPMKWQDAADFIADQNNPAFTCILASAFAAPIFGFTGMPGAMLTIVSTASGVGKTSVLKTAQAVWGSPTRGMNSTSDTYLSIIRKVAFLKNLPVYWDEIRGESALENFYKTAFDIAQGKERTRLNTNAEMREVNDWKTIVVGASNESIFDYMGQAGGQSDAAVARTFEVEVEPFDDPMRATRNNLFAMLDTNFGHAGQKYAEYLATRHTAVQQSVRKAYESIYKEWNMREGERFWAAMVATLLVGAGLAKNAGVVDLDTAAMKKYLRDRLTVLRHKTATAMISFSARELLVAYIQAHQDNQMVIDAMPGQGQKNECVVVRPPKTKLMIVKAKDTFRFTEHDFTKWLKTSHGISVSSITDDLIDNCGAKKMISRLGSRTTYALPKARIIEVTL